jgi:hypothetical protein
VYKTKLSQNTQESRKTQERVQNAKVLSPESKKSPEMLKGGADDLEMGAREGGFSARERNQPMSRLCRLSKLRCRSLVEAG